MSGEARTPSDSKSRLKHRSSSSSSSKHGGHGKNNKPCPSYKWVSLVNGTFQGTEGVGPFYTYAQFPSLCSTSTPTAAVFSAEDAIAWVSVIPLTTFSPGDSINLQLALQGTTGLVQLGTFPLDNSLSTGSNVRINYIPYTGYGIQLVWVPGTTPPAAGTIQVNVLIASKNVIAQDLLSQGVAIAGVSKAICGECGSECSHDRSSSC